MLPDLGNFALKFGINREITKFGQEKNLLKNCKEIFLICPKKYATKIK